MKRFPFCITTGVIVFLASLCTGNVVVHANGDAYDPTIEVDTVWDASHGPYNLEDDLTILPNAELRIAEGAVVHVAYGVTLRVLGTLSIFGTAEQPVFLAPLEGDVGSWGIDVVGGAAHMINIDSNGGQINVSHGRLKIEHSSIHDVFGDAIGAYDMSDVRLKDISFAGISGNNVGLYHNSFAAIENSHMAHGFSAAVGAYDSNVLMWRTWCGGFFLFPCLELYGNASSTLLFNDFERGGTALYNGSTVVPISIVAHQNWWGTTKGPDIVNLADSPDTGVPPYDMERGARIINEITDATNVGSPLLQAASTTPNIVFFPGIKASRLFDVNDNQLWEPFSAGDIRQLSVINYDNDEAATTSVYVGGLIDWIGGLSLGTDIYGSFMKFLDAERVAGHIEAWYAAPYDWRMSPRDLICDDGTVCTMGNAIINLVESAAATAPNGKVVLIGHSNGGRMAHEVGSLMELQGHHTTSLIQAYIDVAVPFEGTFAAITSLLHGYKESIAGGLVLGTLSARSFARLLPISYALLPTPWLTSLSIAGTISSLVSHTTQALTFFVDTWADIMAFIKNESADMAEQLVFSRFATSTASVPLAIATSLYNKVVHQSTWLDDVSPRTKPSMQIPVYALAAQGKETVNGLFYGEKIKCSKGNEVSDLGLHGGVIACVPKTTLYYKPLSTVWGDGVVQVGSAITQRLHTVFESDFIHTKILNLASSTGRSYDHGTILAWPLMQQYLGAAIAASLDNKEPDAFIAGDVNEGATKTSSLRWRLGIHSPVYMYAQDEEGNRTGSLSASSTDTLLQKEEIAGSSYDLLDDDAYITLPFGKKYAIHLIGNAFDLATFDIELLEALGAENERGAGVAASTSMPLIDPAWTEAGVASPISPDASRAWLWRFGPFPVTPTWQGVLQLPHSDTEYASSTAVGNARVSPPDLLIDVDDDGQMDIVLRPNSPVDSLAYASTTDALLNTLCIDPAERKAEQDVIHKAMARIRNGVTSALSFPNDYFSFDPSEIDGDTPSFRFALHIDAKTAEHILTFIKHLWMRAE